MKKKLVVLAIAVGALFLSACATTRIGRITEDPFRYRNRTVHVEGAVTSSFGAIFAGGYQVDDGTGRILVLSTRGVPRKGMRVNVSGRVVSGVTLGGRSFGTAIEEHNHHVRW